MKATVERRLREGGSRTNWEAEEDEKNEKNESESEEGETGGGATAGRSRETLYSKATDIDHIKNTFTARAVQAWLLC